MRSEYLQFSRSCILAIGVGLMLTPIPASAQFGNLFGSTSKDEKAEQPVAPAEGPAVSDPQDTAGPASTEEPATEELATVEPEAANSFDTLCGNGQGKPDENAARTKRKGIFGMADRMASVTRKIPLVGDFLVDSANSLSQSVACRLYPEEQEQAAEATQEATRSGEVGKMVEWESTVRENVSGSSKVSSKNKLPDGTPCMVLADILIVDGEELRVSKTMCKLPGSGHYTIMKP
tara:strand:- start:47130 stop:47831 length:702 start_codon:yes stop_codon:yes gene_type:complete